MPTWQTNGLPSGPRTTLSVGSSPFVWQNPEQVPMTLFVQGVLTGLEISRDGSTYDPVGLLSGSVRLNPLDYVRMTFLITPSVSAYPL